MPNDAPRPEDPRGDPGIREALMSLCYYSDAEPPDSPRVAALYRAIEEWHRREADDLLQGRDEWRLAAQEWTARWHALARECSVVETAKGWRIAASGKGGPWRPLPAPKSLVDASDHLRGEPADV